MSNSDTAFLKERVEEFEQLIQTLLAIEEGMEISSVMRKRFSQKAEESKWDAVSRGTLYDSIL
jgi:hypothetical protein